jgi:hypothetical protein
MDTTLDFRSDTVTRPTAAMRDAMASAAVGDDVVAQPDANRQPIGRVVQVLGNATDPGMEIEIAVRKFDVPHEFSPEALAHAAKLPPQVRPADVRGRVDLRDVPLVTIDGEDARDFDDALLCLRLRTAFFREARGQDQRIAPQRGDLVGDAGGGAIAHRHHGDDRTDANDNTKRGQQRPHQVAAQFANGQQDRVPDHDFAPAGLGFIWSDSIWPSRNRICRPA